VVTLQGLATAPRGLPPGHADKGIGVGMLPLLGLALFTLDGLVLMLRAGRE